jgi:hypothetical protein
MRTPTLHDHIEHCQVCHSDPLQSDLCETGKTILTTELSGELSTGNTVAAAETLQTAFNGK